MNLSQLNTPRGGTIVALAGTASLVMGTVGAIAGNLLGVYITAGSTVRSAEVQAASAVDVGKLSADAMVTQSVNAREGGVEAATAGNENPGAHQLAKVNAVTTYAPVLDEKEKKLHYEIGQLKNLLKNRYDPRLKRTLSPSELSALEQQLQDLERERGLMEAGRKELIEKTMQSVGTTAESLMRQLLPALDAVYPLDVDEPGKQQKVEEKGAELMRQTNAEAHLLSTNLGWSGEVGASWMTLKFLPPTVNTNFGLAWAVREPVGTVRFSSRDLDVVCTGEFFYDGASKAEGAEPFKIRFIAHLYQGDPNPPSCGTTPAFPAKWHFTASRLNSDTLNFTPEGGTPILLTPVRVIRMGGLHPPRVP